MEEKDVRAVLAVGRAGVKNSILLRIQTHMYTVAVLGASDKPERYSNKAVKILKKEGYRVIPIHPTLDVVEDLPVRHTLDAIQRSVDVLTIYVRSEISEGLVEQIIDLKPGVVVINPGAESQKLEAALEKVCIPYHKACTLILLNTGEFKDLIEGEL